MGSLESAAARTQLSTWEDLDLVRTHIDRIAAAESDDGASRALRGWLVEQEGQSELFNVVLYGRTKAGKSTLAEALTGGDGSSIGDGRQRTTRRARAYHEGQVRLVDAPGIGAHDGEEDAATARAQLQHADVVVFVLTDDGLPAAVFEELALVRDTGTPTLFVLNIKDDIEPTADRALWSADADGCFADHAVDELRADIEDQARQRLGIPHPRVLHLHALATLEVARGAQELAGAGRLDELTEMIAREAREHAAARRSRAVLDGASHRFALTAAAVEDTIAEVDVELEMFNHSLAELTERLQHCAHELPSLIRAQVHDHFLSLDRGLKGWLDRHIDDEPKKLEAAWERRVAKADLPAHLAEVQTAAAEQIAEILEASAQDLAADLKQVGELPLTASLDSFEGGPDWHQAARIGKWVVGATILIPGGGLVGIGLRVAASVASAGLGKLQKKLPHVGKQRRQHIARVRTQLKQELVSAGNSVADDMIAQLVPQTGYVDDPPGWDASTIAGALVHELQARVETLQQPRDLLAGQLKLLQAAQSAVDTRLIERLSAAVTGDPGRVRLVERQRGHRTVVRGSLETAAHRSFIWLLDEDIEVVGEPGNARPVAAEAVAAEPHEMEGSG